VAIHELARQLAAGSGLLAPGERACPPQPAKRCAGRCADGRADCRPVGT